VKPNFFDRFLAALRREKADVAETLAETKARLEAGMDRREAEQSASPEERLAAIQRDIDASSDSLEEVRRKIEGRAADPEPPPGPGAGTG
jgi:phage shock protein A